MKAFVFRVKVIYVLFLTDLHSYVDHYKSPDGKCNHTVLYHKTLHFSLLKGTGMRSTVHAVLGVFTNRVVVPRGKKVPISVFTCMLFLFGVYEC